MVRRQEQAHPGKIGLFAVGPLDFFGRLGFDLSVGKRPDERLAVLAHNGVKTAGRLRSDPRQEHSASSWQPAANAALMSSGGASSVSSQAR